MDDKKEKLQNIGIGLDDFEKLRLTNRIYVDKTELIEKMAELSNSFYFLSRPRRFGKSLLCSTIKNLFEGKRHLFKNLWIDDHWNWDRIHPIIHLDMGAGIAENWQEMDRNMLLMMDNLFKQFDLEPNPLATSPSNQFRDLINQLYKKTGKKLVILVDEYDKPIQHHVGEPIEVTMPKGNKGVLIEAIRDKLADFYVVLKEEGAKIEFLILTGVSKFAKVNIFSKLNNLNDITYKENYATLCGYTHEELMSNYGPHLKRLAKRKNLSEEECEKKIKFWYNGYKFHDQAESVFNPFSIVNLMDDGDFSNYWADSGTPTMLINSIKAGNITIGSLCQSTIAKVKMDNLNLTRPNAAALMLQTGYLTIKEKIDDQRFRLAIPNQEIKETFPLLAIEELLGTEIKSEFSSIGNTLRQSLKNKDLQTFLTTFDQLISHLPFELLKKTTYKDKHVVEYHVNESYLHSIFFFACLAADIDIRVEVSIATGKIDAIITTDNHFYLFEFKIDKAPQVALQQIMEKYYYKPFLIDPSRELTIIGVNFCRETKQIDASFRTLREKGSTTPSDGPLINYKPVDC